MTNLIIYETDGIVKFIGQNNEEKQLDERSVSGVQRKKASGKRGADEARKKAKAQGKQRRKKIKRALPRRSYIRKKRV